MGKWEDPVNWEEIYETFDGTMPSCAGGQCQSRCCEPKLVKTGLRQFATYTTSFLTRDEYNHWVRVVGEEELRRLGITIKVEDLGGHAPNFVTLMTDCIGESGCKIPGKKPLQCRTYPFGLSARRQILSPYCPSAVDIAKDPEVLSRIMDVRIGVKELDNVLWFQNLKSEIAKREAA